MSEPAWLQCTAGLPLQKSSLPSPALIEGYKYTAHNTSMHLADTAQQRCVVCKAKKKNSASVLAFHKQGTADSVLRAMTREFVVQSSSVLAPELAQQERPRNRRRTF